ncbi:MAG: UDP-N-acetylglucosamine 2-epimerase (hydrolyzing) [Phycisphaeraceae bacterium]|nr:UDP-N-acetylglucosamine 2-epimerase (hydrolyzing) [Phycisphaeraceae bacterium]
MPRKRVITVVTGSRAEFGLLEPVMRAIGGHPRLSLKTIVTGMHWTTTSWRDVGAAGFAIDARVRMQRRGQVGYAADVLSLSRGVAGIGRAIARIKPDVVLVLGDRIEALAGALAASIGGVRLGHVHGGDRAEGVADEAIRHAISKLAHLHFAATPGSGRRLIRMGEDSARVHVVGSPAVDGLGPWLEFVPWRRQKLVILQHPVGRSDKEEERAMRATLAVAMDYPCVVMAPNADPGSAGIRRAIQRSRLSMVEHLPRPEFLDLLTSAGAIVGNSSAGLIEAAALRLPCVNVGPRQNGREKPANVIDADYGEDSVRRAVQRALKLDLHRMRHPYGDGQTGPRIAKLLARIDLDAISLRKRNMY